MSNLGTYQLMTTLAKKVGGPEKLALLTMVGGYGVFRSGEAIITKIFKIAKKKNGRVIPSTKTIFSVTSDGRENGGLEFVVGDKYRVLWSDSESVLIEKLGDAHNPYFVSVDFLCSISDYKVHLR